MEYYKLSKNEEKRKLLKLVFRAIKLNGSKLEFKLYPAFEIFVNLAKFRDGTRGRT